MTYTYISFLRGINVGGNKKIKMADLRDLYQQLGLVNTKTLLQSGNAIFQTKIEDLAQIQSLIQDGIREQFGFDVDIVLRTPEQLNDVVNVQPFDDDQMSDPSKISFVFLDAIPDESNVVALQENNTGREIIHAGGQELYIFYTDGKGRSKLDNKQIERMLKVKATARNWNTVMKVLNLLTGYPD